MKQILVIDDDIHIGNVLERSLKQHVSNLRRKLLEIGGKEYIETVWGIGFKLG